MGSLPTTTLSLWKLGVSPLPKTRPVAHGQGQQLICLSVWWSQIQFFCICDVYLSTYVKQFPKFVLWKRNC